MENNLMIFNFEQKEIRTVINEKGEPLVCLKDLCDILEISNSRDVASRLNKNGVVLIDGQNGRSNMPLTFINEPNIYKVIFQSRKPEAEKFQNWVYNEVLPSIRKTGKYNYTPLIELLPKEIEQRNIKAILNTAKDQAEFFKLEDTGKMLWGQNLLLKNNLPCPNIPLLTNVNINLYGLSEIYDMFNIRGNGARIKQQSIKSILSEFQNDSEYAVKCMFTSKSGHTDMMYKYTDKSIELIQSKIENINNI